MDPSFSISNPFSYSGQINGGSMTDQFFAALFQSSDLELPGLAMDEPASNASIQSPKIIKSIEYEKSEEECSICLEKLLDKENKDAVVKETPCGHRFHGKCIDKWLEAHRLCPLCRYKMELSDRFWDDRRAWEQNFEISFYSFDSSWEDEYWRYT